MGVENQDQIGLTVPCPQNYSFANRYKGFFDDETEKSLEIILNGWWLREPTLYLHGW
jgi:hypothetical protein